jgi:tryptophan 2-monooxygenase
VFLASCSFSHLGGWLEGAFMSAVNAVAGVVVSLNQGGVAALNPEARKLFTTLKPVIPMT